MWPISYDYAAFYGLEVNSVNNIMHHKRIGEQTSVKSLYFIYICTQLQKAHENRLPFMASTFRCSAVYCVILCNIVS